MPPWLAELIRRLLELLRRLLQMQQRVRCSQAGGYVGVKFYDEQVRCTQAGGYVGVRVRKPSRLRALAFLIKKDT